MVDGYYTPNGTLRLKDYNGTGWYCGFYKNPAIHEALKGRAGWVWTDDDEYLQRNSRKLLVDLKALIW